MKSRELFQKDYITIKNLEYQRLLKKELFLECLESAGVETWNGYSTAVVTYEELTEEMENDDRARRLNLKNKRHRVS